LPNGLQCLQDAAASLAIAASIARLTASTQQPLSSPNNVNMTFSELIMKSLGSLSIARSIAEASREKKKKKEGRKKRKKRRSGHNA